MERNFTGKTVDDAIKAASEELGLSREDFTVEVLENPKSGFLGLTACFRGCAVRIVSRTAKSRPRPNDLPARKGRTPTQKEYCVRT